MNVEWILSGAGERVLSWAQAGKAGQPQRRISPVLTVEEICRQLRKSRRQIYRYLHSGRLKPCAKVLGQWLFPSVEVEDFRKQRIPGRMKPFFWDVQFSGLSPERHRDFILGRLLEYGDREAVAWVLKRYRRGAITAFLRGRGAEVLTQRARGFWLLQLQGRSSRPGKGSWRHRGRRWGGVG